MKKHNADTVIIGGGIIGCSAALRLAQAGQKVILLERQKVGEMASGRAGGGVRRTNRNPLELPFSMEAYDIWGNMAEELEWDVGYRRHGSLMIAVNQKELDGLKAKVDNENALGLGVEMLTPEETRKMNPVLTPELEIAGAKHCSTDGTANPLLVTKAYARMARRKGAIIKEFEPVSSLKTRGDKVIAAICKDAEYHASKFILTAGAWTLGLAKPLGVNLPINFEITRIMITEPVAPGTVEKFTLMQDLYYRQTVEGNIHLGFLCDYPVAEDVMHIHRSQMGDFTISASLMKKYCSGIQHLKIIRTFGGTVYSTPDLVAVIDTAPQHNNLFMIFGCSGHGFGLGPMWGRVMAQWVADGKSDYDLSPFSISRFDDLGDDFVFEKPLGGN
jgi:glycine/D-amino acid oxidase-like deaminating enzyme